MSNLTMSLSCPASGYTISWASDINTGYGGYVSIYKNSSNVVYVTGSTAGSFTANIGDSIEVYVSGSTYSGLNVWALIYKDSVQVATDNQTANVFIYYGFTVQGDHYIDGVTYDQL